MDNPYEVLGLSPDVPFDEVRLRYRELAASSPWERSLGKALADHFDRLAEKAEKAEAKLVVAEGGV